MVQSRSGGLRPGGGGIAARLVHSCDWTGQHEPLSPRTHDFGQAKIRSRLWTGQNSFRLWTGQNSFPNLFAPVWFSPVSFGQVSFVDLGRWPDGGQLRWPVQDLIQDLLRASPQGLASSAPTWTARPPSAGPQDPAIRSLAATGVSVPRCSATLLDSFATPLPEAHSVIETLKSDDIVERLGGRFKLTALIQRRLKELIDGSRPHFDRQGRSDLELVIEEIRQGKITLDFDPTNIVVDEDR